MKASLSQTFLFDAAHHLNRTVPLEEYEASARIHGHTYTAEVTVSGELRNGMIALHKRRGLKAGELDLHILRREIAKVRERLDHRLLDDVPQLGRPTIENLCLFIGRAVATAQLPVATVTVSRPSGDRCRVEFDPSTGDPL